jgi:glutamine cyclotransferase
VIRFCLTISIALSAAMAAAPKDAKGKKAAPALQGVKTPGVLIPFATLKADADIALDAPPTAFLFTDQPMIGNASGIHRFDPQTNKPFDPPADIKVDKVCGGLVNAFEHVWAPSCGALAISKIKLDARPGGGRGFGGRGPRGGPPAAAKPEGDKPADAPKPDQPKPETANGEPPAERLRPAPVKPAPATMAGTLPIETAPKAMHAIAASADSLWLLADGKTNLMRFDPAANAAVATLRLPSACATILHAENSIWVACPGETKILRIDPKTNLVEKRIEVSPEAVALAFGDNAIWVLSRKEGKVSRVDPKTNKVAATIDLGVPGTGGSLAYGEGNLWVSMPGYPIARIDTTAEKEKVVQQFHGEGGGMIAVGLSSIWIASPGSNTVQRFDPKRIAATLAE